MAIYVKPCFKLFSSKCGDQLLISNMKTFIRLRHSTAVIQGSLTKKLTSMTRNLHTSSVLLKEDPILHKGSTSYVRGPTSPPLLDLSVGQALVRAAEKWPDREAIVVPFQNTRKTFSEVLSDVHQLAESFLSIGLKPGDRVGMWGPSSYEWYLTQFATATAGLVLVCVNPAYQPPELLYSLNKVGVSALIASERFKTQDYHGMMFQIMPELATSDIGDLRSSSVPSLKHVVMLSEDHLGGSYRFVDLFNLGGKRGLRDEVDIHSPVNIQFTSGTTGSPKAVTLSHHGIVNNANHIGHRLGYGDKHHRICVSVPLYHCFGNVMAVLCAVMHGATCVFPSPSFQPLPSLKAIESEKCTSFYGTPTMFVDMLSAARELKPNIDQVMTGIMGGSQCPEELGRSVMAELNMSDFVICYGTTEMSPIVFQGFCGDTVERKVGSIGFPSSHLEVAVKNEKGGIAEAGEMGEMVARGYSTMLGYWGDPEKTRDVIDEDGWYHTGDLGIIDETGYGRIVGRITDLIIRGGENIYPAEVEEFLYSHPAVEVVQIVGVPSERLGEEVAAWIKLRSGCNLTQEELKEFCKGKLAHFKVPRYVSFVDEFPKTVTGKIQKYVIKEKIVEQLKNSQ